MPKHFENVFNKYIFVNTLWILMKKKIIGIWRFYVEGFRDMKLGKTLWTIILIKLFIMFFILRIFFFPNFLNSRTKNVNEKHEYVGNELINRSVTNM